MSQVYFTSDLHLQHTTICKYRPGFSTPEAHDEYMLSLFEKLPKRSLVIILGDFLFAGPRTTEILERLGKLPYQIKLVMGNHDIRDIHKHLPDNITLQLPLHSYKSMWLTHCPIHPQEMRGRIGNVHGHLHLESIKDDKYFNVNIDVNNYEFVKAETIKNYFNKEKNAKLDAPYISPFINSMASIPGLLGFDTRL